MNKELLIRNFSRYAATYDQYAFIQKQTAKELLEKMGEGNFKQILEIGSGTGNYSLLLRERFRQARIVSVDISQRMNEVAAEKLKDKNIELITADAESFDPKEKFDLITSNASFQWFTDIAQALASYRGLLKKDGVIAFSIFGPHTLWELNSALKALFKDSNSTTEKFTSKEDITGILEQHFQGVRIKEAIYKENFSSLSELLNLIKFTGVRGDGLGNKLYFGRKLIKSLEEHYLEKFQRIEATYQVFFCQGKAS